MSISVALLCFPQSNRDLMNAVITQLELEHENGKDTSKEQHKCSDIKLVELNHPIFDYQFGSGHFILKNSFIEHFKRYVDPFHPIVPTPPPNIV
ncbi:hypothetical protein [Pedobacter sp. MW01-1-1]|uniref:hypothetical protein n=1 Tax=Pedobacter sp. MW01-1-1 TaxID=3383027 RepID=UPI003FEEBA08